MKTEDLIKKYPKIFQDYEGNPGGVNWFGCPSGWLPIVEDLFGAIQDYIDNIKSYTKEEGWKHPVQFTCTTLKEKLGSLRVYSNTSDYNQNGMVKMAEYLCSLTCTHCGSREDIKMRKGWIEPVCVKCVKENNYQTYEPK